jgi:hypothetical protein
VLEKLIHEIKREFLNTCSFREWWQSQERFITWLCSKLRTAEPEKLLTEAFCMTVDNACIDLNVG